MGCENGSPVLVGGQGAGLRAAGLTKRKHAWPREFDMGRAQAKPSEEGSQKRPSSKVRDEGKAQVSSEACREPAGGPGEFEIFLFSARALEVGGVVRSKTEEVA